MRVTGIDAGNAECMRGRGSLEPAPTLPLSYERGDGGRGEETREEGERRGVQPDRGVQHAPNSWTAQAAQAARPGRSESQSKRLRQGRHPVRRDSDS